jgi:hypothetical protein
MEAGDNEIYKSRASVKASALFFAVEVTKL